MTVGDSLGGQGPQSVGSWVGSGKADIVRFLASNQTVLAGTVTINNSGLLDLNGFSSPIGVLNMVGGTATTNADSGVGPATALTLNGNVLAAANAANLTPASISGNLSLGGNTRTFDVQAGALVSNNPNITIADINDMIIVPPSSPTAA